jgi:uncharacterized membrane protein YfcA
MITLTIAALIVFAFTVVLTIAGVGAAFSIIPFLFWLGFPLKEAMATALLLNSLSMSFASVTFIRNKLVSFHTALPVLIVASTISPIGAYCTQFVSRQILLWLFSCFLAFAGSMMLFFRPRTKESIYNWQQQLLFGVLIGSIAGYIGGLLGVGGGNLIVPALIWIGFDPRKAAATSGFIVIFSSLSAFFGHVLLGNVNLPLLGVSAFASIGGGLLGAWLISFKLKGHQVKVVVGLVLYIVAIKMVWGLLR